MEVYSKTEVYSNRLNWEPLVTDEKIKLQILGILDKLSEAIYTKPDISNPGLLGGNAGLSLFWEYYQLLTGIKNYRKHSLLLLNESIRVMQTEAMPYSFGAGIAGILWTYNHLVLCGAIDQKISSDKTIGEYLLKRATAELKEKQYDYLHGPIGIALYFLMLTEEDYAVDALSNIISELSKASVEFPEGITWEDKLNPKYLVNINKGTRIYNLGLAHGVPSIIAILSVLTSKEIAQADTLSLLRKSISWILNKKKDEDSFSLFPIIVGIDIEDHNARLAWCYGDLSIAIALLRAGILTNNKIWKEEAIEIALHSSKKKDLVTNGLKDAGICHGTAGVCHVFNRFYQYTGREEFKLASNYWLIQTLKLYESPIGFLSLERDPETMIEEYKENNSLLGGLAGIGLVLISAISNVEPKWDACLLLS